MKMSEADFAYWRKRIKNAKPLMGENLTTKEWYTKYRGVDWDLIAERRKQTAR